MRHLTVAVGAREEQTPMFMISLGNHYIAHVLVMRVQDYRQASGANCKPGHLKISRIPFHR